MKVYADHVFIVADMAADHGMQVFDLTRLREFSSEMLTFEMDAHYDRINSVHNIVINEETGFAYAVGSSGGGDSCGGGLHMVNIQEPKNPVFAGCFADPSTGRSGTGYSHDAQCVIYDGPDREHAGKEICFGSNETALSIADVTDKDNPIALAMGEYPNVAYTHQGWLTEDQAYFYMNDELDEVRGLTQGTRTLIWDVSDLDEPIMVKEHISENTASDHNLYIVGNLNVPVQLQQRTACSGHLRRGQPARSRVLRHRAWRGLPLDGRLLEQLSVLRIRGHRRNFRVAGTVPRQEAEPHACFLIRECSFDRKAQ